MLSSDKRKTSSFSYQIFFLLILAIPFAKTTNAQQVTEVITDFGGFWKSTTAANNATWPNNSHNVLSFKYNSVIYSTGVDDVKLNSNSITYTAGDFRAFPVSSVGGTVTGGASIYIALASQYDGIPNGYSNPLPSLKIKDVLIDGIHGLDIGTGATNIPASALVNFPINAILSSSINDAKPDILVSQIASPTSSGDTLYYINSSGAVVGNKIAINWTTISKLGTYYLDLYSLPSGALCDTAKISGAFDKETNREIRLAAYTLADFGITTGNASSVTGFILKASGTSDPAFIAYNTDAFVIPAPVITVQPATQVVCPNASHSVTFSVTATGGSLSYQWRKNNVDIAGATSSTYSIANVVTASAGAYNVVVSNPVGSVASNTAYLNVSIGVQPSPSSQVIATGASCTLIVSASNATGYQWKKAGADIAGATTSTYVISPVTSTNLSDYTVQVQNSANAGCANITSSVASVTGSVVLYSKPGADLNLPGSWGVATDGSGSSPVDFTRSEHTFVVKNNAATGGNLTIAGTLDVANAVTTITGNTTLDANRIIRSGTGALAGSSTSSLIVRDTSTLYFQAGNDMLKNFTVNGGNISLASPLSIVAGSSPGTVTLNGGTLNTSDNLTFKSDASGTARLATITGGALVNGKATIERYIPAARGWRFLSVPISSTGAPTINAAWQEGLTTASSNPNLYPGYGVKIAGGTTANGYDASNTNSSFIKAYNNTTSSFVVLPSSPGTNIPITNYPAYCLYIRGDRSIDLMQGLNAAITSTTLRIKGQLKTGNQAMNVNAGNNYTLMGNPYPSAIDFGTLTKSNVGNTMYIWDPKMAGNYGIGAYVTVSWNSATGMYDATTSNSTISRYIASGEAFFVYSADHVNPGTLTIKESDKTASGIDQVYRTTGAAQKLRTNLYLVNADSSTSLLDGVLTTFDDLNSNDVDGEDARKLINNGETIGLSRDNNMLSIERRKTIAASDTVFLNISRMKIHDYKFEIAAENLDMPGLIGFVKDNYSNTVNNMPVNMNGITSIPFSINSDPASYAVNRFSIVFAIQGPLPVTIRSIKAYRQQKNINVEWSTDNEINIKEYELEKSADGRNFASINIAKATASNGGSASYKFTDQSPFEGNNYYRILSIENDGKAAFTNIVKVVVPVSESNSKIVVYPNPVTGNTVSLQFNNIRKGNYTVKIFNNAGQLIATKLIEHSENVPVENIELSQKIVPGKYELIFTGDDIKLNASLIKK